MKVLGMIFVLWLLSVLSGGYAIVTNITNTQTTADPACDAQLEKSSKAIRLENACTLTTTHKNNKKDGIEICPESCPAAVSATYDVCNGKRYTSDDDVPAMFSFEPFLGLVQLIPDDKNICKTSVVVDFINIHSDEMTCQDWLGMSIVAAASICNKNDATTTTDDDDDGDRVLCPLACTTVIDGVYRTCDATTEYTDPNDETNVLSALDMEVQANFFRRPACIEYAASQSSWTDFGAVKDGSVDGGMYVLDDDDTMYETTTMARGDAACNAALNSAMAAVFGAQGACTTLTRDENGKQVCHPSCLDLLLAGHMACLGKNYTTSDDMDDDTTAFTPTDLVFLLLYEPPSEWLCNQPVVSHFLERIEEDLTCDDWLTLSLDSVSTTSVVSLCDDDDENFGSSCPVGCVSIIDGVYESCNATSEVYRADTGLSWSAAVAEQISMMRRGPRCQNYTNTKVWHNDYDSVSVVGTVPSPTTPLSLLSEPAAPSASSLPSAFLSLQPSTSPTDTTVVPKFLLSPNSSTPTNRSCHGLMILTLVVVAVIFFL